MNMTASLFYALSFAARRHGPQKRKDPEKTPYINHVIDVATILAVDGNVSDETILVAAILHDTVEDTDTTFDELTAEFGEIASELVSEMTDDKTLPKAERKRLQVLHAPEASDAAKQIKIADKIANVRDVAHRPGAGWSLDRRREYIDWSDEVVAGCRGVNARLDKAFDAAARQARAEIAAGATRSRA